jgi:hypothetical protein
MQLANLSNARFAATADMRTPLRDTVPAALADLDGFAPDPQAAISVAAASVAATRGNNAVDLNMPRW